MKERQEKKGLNISVTSFVAALLVLLLLMAATYLLTFVIPGSSGIPFWRWLLSPVLLLGAEGSGTIIAVIAFLLVVGGVFNGLEKGGLMKYMLGRIVSRFGSARYRLMAVVALFFMSMGAFIGSFEECVPLVPLVVGMAVSLGWDPIIGLGMSILAAGCGFASGVSNPFTVGVAQELVGLPMFSGVWLRILSFVLIYSLLMWFLQRYAKKIERPLEAGAGQNSEICPKKNRGLWCFVGILGIGVALVFCSALLPFLQDLTMIIVALMFLVAGITANLVSGMSVRDLGKHFVNGLVSILPAVLMILMAGSIRFTMEEAGILEIILHSAVEIAGTLPKWVVILFIYLLVLAMNFFISSGSAKAFLLMPLITPLAEVFGISAQLCVVAFAFGDGFSNVFYPTNPVLLISLGLADVSYGKWVKWSWKFQAANLLLTSLVLLFGMIVGY